MTTRKRPEGAQTEAKAKKTARPGGKPRRAGAPVDAPRRTARGAPAAGGARPRIHASHASPSRPETGPKRAAKPRAEARPRPRTIVDQGPPADVRAEAGEQAELMPSLKAGGARPKRALAGPKRAGKVRTPAELAAPEPSSAARELALALSAAALDKKAVGVEILDVTGKVDYADFLLVMTGRSDRHVHAIATGIEDAMRKRRVSPLSVEGLTGATWVLLDFGDVVVHVFQEEARALYDIEGLWIDAGRIPVPDAEAAARRGAAPPAS